MSQVTEIIVYTVKDPMSAFIARSAIMARIQSQPGFRCAGEFIAANDGETFATLIEWETLADARAAFSVIEKTSEAENMMAEIEQMKVFGLFEQSSGGKEN